MVFAWLLGCADGILYGLGVVSMTVFFIVLGVVMVILNFALIPGLLSEMTRTYGSVVSRRDADGKVIFEATIRQTKTTKALLPNKIVPFHGFVLVEEKWRNYAFMTVEAARALEIY